MYVEKSPGKICGEAMQRWEADGYLLSLPSYPLLLKNASTVGKMFYLSLFGNDHDAFKRRLCERLAHVARTAGSGKRANGK